MRRVVSPDTRPRPASASDAVVFETPARFATSTIVATRPPISGEVRFGMHPSSTDPCRKVPSEVAYPCRKLPARRLERSDMTTGYVWLERYGWHDTGRYAGFRAPGASVQPAEHFESADSKVRLASIIEVSGLAEHLVRLAVTAATEADLLRVHTPDYVARVQAESAHPKGGDAGDGM